MKNLKQVIAQIKNITADQTENLPSLLWQLICYSPKMPLRLVQQQLLAEATPFSLKVEDEYFSKKQLLFNGFKWGNGKRKVLITHGWGSKAADFTEMITALQKIDDLQIIAFDAPGNGSSAGGLSNLLLFAEAVKAIISNCGLPNVMIGHSLGAMANVFALKELRMKPGLLISLAPLVRLKENFETSLSAVGVPKLNQDQFLKQFEIHFGRTASSFNLLDLYDFDSSLNHWLAYDRQDQVLPYPYLEEFLAAKPFIKSQHYEGAGHERIIKAEQVILDVAEQVKLLVH